MLSKSKKIWLITGGIVLLLVLTNPSLSTFKEYRGKDPKKNYEYVRRQLNLFVLSVYVDNTDDNERYIGIFGNFIDISKKYATQEKMPTDSSVIVDSVKISMAMDTSRPVIETTENELPIFKKDSAGIVRMPTLSELRKRAASKASKHQ